MTVELVKPGLEHLPSYLAALRRGWSPDNIRGAAAAEEQIKAIEADPAAFIGRQEDLEAKGPPVTLPDASTVPRLPGFTRWVWDEEFCGSISFRWQPGTSALPERCLGHVGYAVVPWKRGRGHATFAVRQLLPEIEKFGLAYIEITTDPDNVPSQKVITACGGRLLERGRRPAAHGGTEMLRYWIDLKPSMPADGV
jgi:predicted acetyltransferase